LKRKTSERHKGADRQPVKPIARVADLSSEESSPDDVLVVAIGASAGGLEAFTELLTHLPNDTGMAFVLVQHLDPKHESMLTELTSRSTKMPVLQVKNGMGIEPNHVYVIPPNTTMTIYDHTLQLKAREEIRGQHMAVDSFMRALAEAQGNKAIGVILSGAGTDGTLGLAEIQAQGGVTFAQDETSAKYDGMPRSAIATGSVDFVLPPAEIARELTRIARHPSVARPAKDEAGELAPEQHMGLNTIFQLVRKSTGVDFTHYRHTTIRRRIQRRMIVHKIDTLPRYVKYVQQNPAELKALYQDMLVNVTSFFRNPASFDALKTRVFPGFLKDRSADTPIRIWAPGCSSGEETYSLAIALLEFLGDKASSVPIQIFGSDVGEVSINKARNGLYPENIQGDVSADRLRRFFVKVEGGYRINKNVRDMSIFAQHNLLSDPPFSQMDLISCRNLLIYLEAPLQKNVISLFHYALKPHGFLVLGNAESVGAMTSLFALEDRANKIYSKRSTGVRAPVAFAMGHRGERAEPGGRPHVVPRQEAPWNAVEAQKEFDRRLLQQFSPAAVFVDDGLEVVHSRGNVDPYLKLSSGRPTLSILKMAREGLLLELRNAINRAKKDHINVRRENVEVKADHSVRDVSFEVIPLRVTHTHEPYLMIVFEEADAEPRHLPRRRAAALRTQASSKRIMKLQQELAITTEYLHNVIERQEATNEELQSANEEILSSNEELQSTNEELETAKEELQSANEELTTVNDELRSRNQEITQANNDLNNLLTSIDVAVVMLGSDLAIRRFTPEAQKLLGLIPADMGRPFSNINAGLNMGDLQKAVTQVMNDFTPVEQSVGVRSGKAYRMRITPYRTSENKVEGAVLTFGPSLTEKQRQEAVDAEHSTEFVLVLDPDLHIKAASPSFYRAFHISKESIESRPLDRLNHFMADNPELQKALQKAQQTGDTIAPLTIELRIDGDQRRKFQCMIDQIMLDGGAKVITLSMHAPSSRQQSSQMKA
jgi:two-component system, chemotaxis family, CheB/CheR fusion protein